MRHQLQPFLGCKYLFSATVDKFGLVKRPYSGEGPTVCLRDVLLHVPGSVIVPVDHVWATVGKTFARFNPSVGDRISFNAWVREYYKFNFRRGEERLDYCICRLSNFDTVSSDNPGKDFATFWRQVKGSRRFISNVQYDLIAAKAAAEAA